MRILLVHQGYPPESAGGSEIYLAALARQLASEHQVAVLHRAQDPARADYEVRESRRDGVRLFALNNLHREAPGFESYRDPGAAAAAEGVLERFSPDLVHVHHLNGLSTGIVFSARLRGVPVVLTLHDFWPLCPLGQLLDLDLHVCSGPSPRRCLACVGGQVAPVPRRARSAGRRLPLAEAVGRRIAGLGPGGAARIASRLDEMHEVLRAADGLVSPSRFLRDRLAELGVTRIEVVPNGHEPLSPSPRTPDPEGRLTIGFVGAAIPSKGVHVLAEAFRLLGRPDAALRIHGPFLPYHGDATYEARVRAILGSGAGEALCGPFPPEALGEVLAGLDVLVVPSLWEENAPLTVQEAFLARVPVVVSDHGGLAEAVRDGVDGLRFPPADSRALAGALRRLLDEPMLRARLAASAPPVPTMADHAAALAPVYDRARRRYRTRVGKVGVVVLEAGGRGDAAAAARSAMDPTVEPRTLLVRNGPMPGGPTPKGVALVRLLANRGFAAGMNSGIDTLRAGCDRFLLLNSDATLEPGAVRRLAEALEDETIAAAGPLVLRSQDGRVESRGARFDLHSGRQRLSGHGERAAAGEGTHEVEGLSGAVLMISARALDRIGPFDEDYFFSFEDADWCRRARQAGLRLVVVRGAVAYHVGGATIGAESPDRLYYAARNHLRAAERLLPLQGLARWLRRGSILALNLALALKGSGVPRRVAVRAVLAGTADFWRGRFGPRRDHA
ncbi:MAG TPA: glycosyltransferase [Vicinamibacteria bacterium]|nr:glycosyltransferase [Vicinamibacteria bacterium]